MPDHFSRTQPLPAVFHRPFDLPCPVERLKMFVAGVDGVGKRSDGSTVAAVGSPLQSWDFLVRDVPQGGAHTSLALGWVGPRRWRSRHTAQGGG